MMARVVRHVELQTEMPPALYMSEEEKKMALCMRLENFPHVEGLLAPAQLFSMMTAKKYG